MRILFQGDSITDCLRSSYDSGAFVGSGYPCLIQADLCLNRTDIEVLNCGISGNRVTNLLARWKKDCINLHPDVISILIGVNDVWHELSQQEAQTPDALFALYLARRQERKGAEQLVVLLYAVGVELR